MTKILSIALLNLILLSVQPAEAMLKLGGSEGAGDDDRTPTSDKTRAVPQPASESKAESSDLPAIGRELLQKGYFVYPIIEALFKQEGKDTPHELQEEHLTLHPIPRAEFIREITAEDEEFGRLMAKAQEDSTQEELERMKAQLAGMNNMKAQIVTLEPNPDGLDPFLRFSLNCLMETTPSSFPAAVLIPVPALLPDVAHLSPLETCVWKPNLDLRQLEGAVLMLPESAPCPEGFDWGKLKVQTYTGKLRPAVNDFIDEHTQQRLIPVSLSEEENPYTVKAMLGEVNVYDPNIFTDILRERPYISFGMEAAPYRVGIGSWMNTLIVGVDEFNKLYGIGQFKTHQHAGPRFVKKCRVEPLIKLVEVSSYQLLSLLSTVENKEWLTDFREVQYPKVKRALTNFARYVEHCQTPQRINAWNIRIYPSEVPLRLADYPYDTAQQVLEDKCLNSVREENTLLYWFARYLQGFHGVWQDDQDIQLEQLGLAASALREKLSDETKFTWSYAQQMNNILTLIIKNRRVDGFPEHFLKGLAVLRPIMPKGGTFPYATLNDKKLPEAGNIKFKQTLLDAGIELPSDFYDEGLEVPKLFAPYGVLESM